MGMFDGASGRGELASTAHVAKLLQAPVVLVVDAGAMARSAAAIVHGYRTFDPEVDVAGRDLQPGRLRPPRGAAARGDRRRRRPRPRRAAPRRPRRRPRAPSRPGAGGRARRADARGARRARRRPPPATSTWTLSSASPARPRRPTARRGSAGPGDEPAPARIAIARGPAFSFHYEENLELLARGRRRAHAVRPDRRRARCPRAPTRSCWPAASPRSSAPSWRPTRGCAQRWRRSRQSGRPILAECGGLLYLCAELDGRAMCGVLPARGRMAGRLTLGYREATAATATPWIAAGAQPARARVPLLARSSRSAPARRPRGR